MARLTILVVALVAIIATTTNAAFSAASEAESRYINIRGISITDVYRPSPQEANNMTVPALPFDSYSTWTVHTKTEINQAGNTSEVWSYGFHSNVDASSQVVCMFGKQELFPVQPYYTTTTVLNYSAGTNRTVMQHNGGENTNCSDVSIAGSMQPGGIYFLAPTPAMMKRMTFLQYAVANGNNCSVWQFQTPGQLFQWYVALNTNIPQVMVNETLDDETGNRTIMTTAFNGYNALNGLNSQCTSDLTCGARTCVANPAASPSTLGGALGWVCGVENCGNINDGGSNYYPNTDLAHATWAFNEYYQNHKAGGAGSCNFNGAAELVACSTTCTRCNVTKTATKEQMDNALSWICGPKGIQNGGCAAIRPGGSHFAPNNTRAHLDYAFNLYYQAYRCIPSVHACDFNGIGSIVPCH